MERTLLWVGFGVLAIVLASRRVRPEIPAAAALLFLLSADLLPVRDVTEGLARSGLLLAVLLFADGFSPVLHAVAYRWFGSGREAPARGLLITAVAAAALSALAQGGRVLKAFGAASTSPTGGDAASSMAIRTRIVILHACMFGSLLTFVGNVIYPMAGGRLMMDTTGFGLLEQATVGLAVLAVSTLAALPWLRGASAHSLAPPTSPASDSSSTYKKPIAASLIMLGWVTLVEARYIFEAETFIIGWLVSTVCTVLPFAVSGYLLMRGRKSPIVSRCLIAALAFAMLLIPGVPALAAIGGAALVLALLPPHPFGADAPSIPWGIPLQFVLLTPVAVVFLQTGMADLVAGALLIPLIEAGPFTLLTGWMLLVLLLANTCGSIFTLVLLIPLGSISGAIYGDSAMTLALLTQAIVGTAAASLAPDLWGKCLPQLNIAPREHWRPLLAGQAIVFVVAMLAVWMLFPV